MLTYRYFGTLLAEVNCNDPVTAGTSFNHRYKNIGEVRPIEIVNFV